MYVHTFIHVYVYTYVYIYPLQCVFSFQDSKKYILYVFISNTHSLPWYYHGNILSDYYLIRLTFFTAIVQWYKPIRQKECDILSLYVQIAPLLPSFPINLPSDTDKPYFTGVETKCTAQDSPGNSNLSSPNPFPNHFLMYKSAHIELSNVILEISQTFQDLSIFHYFSLEHFFKFLQWFRQKQKRSQFIFHVFHVTFGPYEPWYNMCHSARPPLLGQKHWIDSFIVLPHLFGSFVFPLPHLSAAAQLNFYSHFWLSKLIIKMFCVAKLQAQNSSDPSLSICPTPRCSLKIISDP